MESMEFIRVPLRGKLGTGKFTLVDGDYDGEFFSQFKWYLHPTGYAVRSVDGIYSYLHQEVSKPPKGMWVDHINRNRLDNRSCNLRWVTPSESAINRLQNNPTVGSSGYFGVQRNHNKWIATFAMKHIGSYSTAEEAARAYDKASKAKYGTLARLNFS